VAIILSEWLPNPEGPDALGEWVEIWNDGPAPASLFGWTLINAGGDTAVLDGDIGPGARKVFYRSTTGLTLRNSMEEISLLAPGGKLAEKSSFFGDAPAGRSVNYKDGRTYLSAPTPGAPNGAPGTAYVETDTYAPGTRLSLGAPDPIIAMLFAAALLTAAGTVIMRAHDKEDQIPDGDPGLGV
jgi:hypothetical protein